MYDLLIIGSGGAGLSAALAAKEKGARVLLVSKQYATHSQTCQAQGGINAVLSNKHDSVNQHIKDTLDAAYDLADEKAVQLMCMSAKETISWLDSIGVTFSRDENNQIAQRKFGGGKYDRTCYSSDYTGLKILHTLYDRAIKEEIEFLNEHLLLNLIVEDEKAYGASFLDIQSGEIKQILAKSTIIATGGYSGIYDGYTTNSSASTGDGIIAAYKAGAILSNMEFVQFHPSALKNSKILISESARGEGAYLINSDGQRFIDELLPRDIVARAIYEQIKQNKKVYLDLRHLDEKLINEKIPQEKHLAKVFEDIDISKELLEIIPLAHYSMGGIKTDMDAKTNIQNLYACGECAEAGIHGANRLGGNSLLEIITFGKIAGEKASQNAFNINTIKDKEFKQDIKDKKYIEHIYKYSNEINFYHIKEDLGKSLYDNMGLYKDEESMKETLLYIKDKISKIKSMGIKDKSKKYNQNLVNFLEFENILQLALLVSTNSLDRKESRGSHYRIDYPNTKKSSYEN